MVGAEDAVRIYRRLAGNGIQVWLTGGWGIDALLEVQTRPHKDLDVIMLLDDVLRMRALLGRDGFGLKELWSENLWVADGSGLKTATAFVLEDGEGREVDVHAMRLDEQGNGIPAWASEGLILGRYHLGAVGLIDGQAVRCITPEMQLLCHRGYELPDKQLRDVERLCEELGVGSPNARA
jgi:lincosamide nucleotidyltransferase A/C/D/E